MKPKMSISLYLSGTKGDMDLDIITSELNVIPTMKKNRNEYSPQSIKAGFAKDVWKFKMEKEISTLVSQQIEKLQCIFSQKINIINDLCSKYKLEASVTVVEMEAGNGPEFVLTQKNIHF